MIFKAMISVLLTPYSDKTLLDLTRDIYRGVTQVWRSWAGAAAADSDELGELGRSQDSQYEPLLLPLRCWKVAPTPRGSLASAGGFLWVKTEF